MIGDSTDSLCPDDYDTGSQLGDAVEFLDEHPGQMAFITINIGTNDIGECQGNPACFIPQIATNLPLILDTLREHAGPDVPIVGAIPTTPSSWTGSTTQRPASLPLRRSSCSTISWSCSMRGRACRWPTSNRPLPSPISRHKPT